MKVILLALLLTGCTQKYQTYHVIDKYNFDKDDPQTPITPKMRPGLKTTNNYCEGQIFFASNAKTNTDRYVKNMVKSMCPDSDFLLNSKLTETWWTTIIYSRSCVELEAHCPLKLKNN
jgi:hypothetical protein